MTTQKQIEAAYDALEVVLAQTLWTHRERERLKLAVIEAILIKRRKKHKVLR